MLSIGWDKPACHSSAIGDLKEPELTFGKKRGVLNKLFFSFVRKTHKQETPTRTTLVKKYILPLPFSWKSCVVLGCFVSIRESEVPHSSK